MLKTRKPICSDGTRPKATPPPEVKCSLGFVLDRFGSICSILGCFNSVFSEEVAKGFRTGGACCGDTSDTPSDDRFP